MKGGGGTFRVYRLAGSTYLFHLKLIFIGLFHFCDILKTLLPIPKNVGIGENFLPFVHSGWCCEKVNSGFGMHSPMQFQGLKSPGFLPDEVCKLFLIWKKICMIAMQSLLWQYIRQDGVMNKKIGYAKQKIEKTFCWSSRWFTQFITSTLDPLYIGVSGQVNCIEHLDFEEYGSSYNWNTSYQCYISVPSICLQGGEFNK